MFHVVTRTRIAVACVAVVAVLAWMRPSLEAREAQFGGMAAGGGGEEAAAPPTARVYFKAPVTADAAKVWIKLGQKVSMPFEQETPLEDLVKFVKTATSDKETPNGLSVYVDPLGLSEAEKTLASPIALNLENIKLGTALKLAHDQLDLTFRVHPDGLLIVTSKDGRDSEYDDPNVMILDKLEALQAQVNELRRQLAPHGRPQPAPK